MRFGVALLFVSSGVWLLAFGLGFLPVGMGGWWSDWAWKNTVARIFVHTSPIASVAFRVGAIFPNVRVDAVLCIAGSALYLVVGFALLIGYSNGRRLIAFVCWINTVSVLFKILMYMGRLNFNPWLLLDAAIGLAFLCLGFRAYAGAFTRTGDGSPKTAVQTS